MRALGDRSVFLTLAALYTSGAIYGSFVPFDVHPRPLGEAWEAFLALRTSPVGIQSRADWAANVLLFLPLAYLWCGALWPRRPWARAVVAASVWAGALTLSASIEFVQSFFPSRSVSLNDVVAEGVGAAAGVLAWALTGARSVAWLRSLRAARTVEDLAARLVVVWVAGVVVFSLIPFDLSLSPALAWRKFAAGRVRLLPLPTLEGGLLAALGDVLLDGGLWVPVGLLGRLGFRAPAGVVWLGCVALAAAVEALQLLVYSRTVDLSDVTLAALGAGLGVVVGGRLAPRPAGSGRPPEPSSRLAWLGALGFALWLTLVVLVLWQPFDFTTERGFVTMRARQLSLVPFRAYLLSSELRALTEAVRKTLLFLPLGAMAALALEGVPVRARARASPAVAGLIGAVAVLLEGGKVFLPTRTVDTGNILLEVGAGVLGYAVVRSLARRARVRGAVGGP